MIEYIKYGLSKINEAADWVADRIISKPKLSKVEQQTEEAIEVGTAASAAVGLGYAATYGGIALTEALSAAGASATVLNTTAAIAAAGTEVAAGGAAIASGGAEIAVVGGVLLFSAAVAGKVAGRAGGHLYNYFTGANQEETKEESKEVDKDEKQSNAFMVF